MTGIRKFGRMLAAAGVFIAFVAIGEPLKAETAPFKTEPLTLAAAHSLKPALQEMVPMFELEYGATVHVLYGPSETLRRQIERGAPICVFLPGAVKEVETLHKKGLSLNGGPRIYAQTSLVLVMSTTSPISVHDILPKRRIRLAVADPKTSTLGKITARALTKLDPAYRKRFHLLHAQHSDEILNLVRTGKADLGLVYRVDAINGGQVRIIDESLVATPTPVLFGQALVSTCRNESLPVAEEFFDFLLSRRIQKLLLKFGFDPVPS